MRKLDRKGIAFNFFFFLPFSVSKVENFFFFSSLNVACIKDNSLLHRKFIINDFLASKTSFLWLNSDQMINDTKIREKIIQSTTML